MGCHDTKRISHQLHLKKKESAFVYLHTCRDRKNDQTCSSPKKQHCTLRFLSAKALNKWVATEASEKLCDAEDELGQVDIQAKISHVQTDSIVYQADHKPANGMNQWAKRLGGARESVSFWDVKQNIIDDQNHGMACVVYPFLIKTYGSELPPLVLFELTRYSTWSSSSFSDSSLGKGPACSQILLYSRPPAERPFTCCNVTNSIKKKNWIKCCVAKRPLNYPFKQRFGNFPAIDPGCIQDYLLRLLLSALGQEPSSRLWQDPKKRERVYRFAGYFYSKKIYRWSRQQANHILEQLCDKVLAERFHWGL